MDVKNKGGVIQRGPMCRGRPMFWHVGGVALVRFGKAHDGVFAVQIFLLPYQLHL